MDEKKIQLPLRLDPQLHDRLRRAAERERRSINSLVLVYVERGLREDERRAREEQGR